MDEEFNAIHNKITSLTRQMNETRKKISDLEKEKVMIIKECSEDVSRTLQYRKEFKEKQTQEEEYHKTYLTDRKERETHIKALREKYRVFIKENKKDGKEIDFSKCLYFAGVLDDPENSGHFEELFKAVWIPDDDIIIDDNRPVLGRGLHSQVYKGTCRGIEVAVKVLSNRPKGLEEFRRECHVLKNTVGHPNLLLFMGACMEERKYKLVLEWARNGSLEDVIKDPKHTLTFRRKIKMLNEICSAMNWLHTRSNGQILHLNLNPSNILFTSSWSVKIANYGTAGSVIDYTDPAKLADKSIFYVAPELLDGQPATQYCDIYSFGILAWHILTEKDPYTPPPTDFLTFKSKVINGLLRPPMPKSAPSRLRDIFQECWAPLPDQRKDFGYLTQHTWDSIIKEATIQGQEEAERMWQSLAQKVNCSSNKQVPTRPALPTGLPLSVPYPDFVKEFANFLNVEYNTDIEKSVRWKCVHAILEVSNNMVSHENFLRFLNWFGPVGSGEGVGNNFLQQIENLLRQEWFYGNIDQTAAEQRILSDQRSKTTTLFLLRFSKKYSTFTVTFRKKGKENNIQHERLSKENWTDIPTLIHYIDKEFKKKRRLSPCKYERSFDAIFSSSSPNDPSIDPDTNGYTESITVAGK